MVDISTNNNNYLILLNTIDKQFPIPFLFESWNWIGEESVLIYKVRSK